jgi:hypothetical protein
MSKRTFWLGLCFSMLLAANASAGLVGSWQVDDGPDWGGNPIAYNGQQAAALLFGGLPTDYSISTNSSTITHTAWYSIIFVGGGTELAENYPVPGHYQDEGGTSAYVNDNAIGDSFTNYAFTAEAAVPEPATGVLLVLSIAGIVVARNRRFV